MTRSAQILERFGSLDKLASASDEALRELGLNAKIIVDLRRALAE